MLSQLSSDHDCMASELNCSILRDLVHLQGPGNAWCNSATARRESREECERYWVLLKVGPARCLHSSIAGSSSCKAALILDGHCSAPPLPPPPPPLPPAPPPLWVANPPWVTNPDSQVPSIDGMFGEDEDAIEQLLDFFRRSQRGARLSIAVVGSSGNTLYRRLGMEIDSKDVVLRFNDATTDGFAEDVGHGYPSRTNGLVRVLWQGGLENARAKNAISPGEQLIVTCPDRLRCDGYWSPEIRDNDAYYIKWRW